MRIVVATSAPFYWQPQAECLVLAMRQAGHEAYVANPQTLDGYRGHRFDALLCLGTGQSLRPTLDAISATARLLYLIEPIPLPDEVDKNTQERLAAHAQDLPSFDHVFVHTPRSMPMLRSLGVTHIEALIWPHFPTLFAPTPGAVKDIDVLFIGTLSSYRMQVLALLKDKVKVAFSNTFHAASAAWYARAKIALNIHFSALKNLECRVIESLGCETFLLTEALDPPHWFADQVHLAVFDHDSLAELVRHYLADAPLRQRIAAAGHRHVQQFRVETQIEPILRAASELIS